MTFFTTNKIIVLSLILIIGLAIIAYYRKYPEGYVNTKTMYSDFAKRIDPTIRIINYFSGKPVMGCPEMISSSMFYGKFVWQPDEGKLAPAKKLITYSGDTSAVKLEAIRLENQLRSAFQNIKIEKPTTMSEEEYKKLVEAKTNAMTEQELYSAFDNQMTTQIALVTERLKEMIGAETYATEVAKLDFSDVVSQDKTPYMAKLAFLYGMGGIGDAKMTELYNKIWDSSTTADAIETSLKALGLKDYDLKMRVYNEVVFFNKSGDLTNPKVSEIYASIKADSSTDGLNKIVSNYLINITDYANKKLKMSSGENTKQSYNANVVDVTYHDSADKLKMGDDSEIMVPDKDGKMVKLPWDKAVTTIPRYNDSSYFRYSPSPYVPNYEDSVYLSRLTSYNDNAPVVDYAKQLPASAVGFCDANKKNPIETEIQCGKIDKTACASTSCCVLLGGAKCVAGNQGGPTMKANYSDIGLLNKDYYYYQGKCYGNCPP
jgi:hypothetical protein